jgi:hypothetical protein
VSEGVESLKVLVFEFHEVHGVGGDFLACFECVIAALNKAEFDAIERANRRGFGV